MKILKDAGTFEVLTKTEDIINNIANVARTCYQSQEFANEENNIKLVKSLITRGHHAMIEFADMTVKFKNCSRGLTHELVRHRLCSFAQESTRYVDEKDFEFVVPPNRDEESYDESVFNFKCCLNEIGIFYRNFRERGWKAEDARQILPTALHAEIVLKANLREWRHIFTMRCDLFAHWEIRSIMLKLLKWCKENIPVIFDDFKFYKTKDGIEYARPVMSSLQLSTKMNDYFEANQDLNALIDKLNPDLNSRLFVELKNREFK